MFKTLNSLENKMRSVLKELMKSSKPMTYVCSLSIDESNALEECLKRNYVNELKSWPDENGNYHFDPYPNIHVSYEGLDFIKKTSFIHRILQSIFDLLKGTLGFILGILSTIISAYIVWKCGWL